MLGVASEVKAYSPHILREKTKVPEEHENTNKLYYGTWQEIDPHICLRQDNIKKKKKMWRSRDLVAIMLALPKC